MIFPSESSRAPRPPSAIRPARGTTRFRSSFRIARSTRMGRLFYPDNRAFFEESQAVKPEDPVRSRGRLHRGERRAANLESGVLRQHDRGERPDVAVSHRRAAALSIPRAQRMQYTFHDPEAFPRRSAVLADRRRRRFPARAGRPRRLLIAPGERADVIVDFTNVPVGTEIVLQNLGPDEPFGGGEPGKDFERADP